MIDLTRFPCRHCGKQILNSDNAMACPSCHIVMHKKCWQEVGGCITPGCDVKYQPDESGGYGSAVAPDRAATAETESGRMDPNEAIKIKNLLDKYGLGSLGNAEDIKSVRRVASELIGTGLMETGMIFGGDRSVSLSDRLQVHSQRAMLEQNWIIIRQLDRLNSNIEKLLEK